MSFFFFWQEFSDQATRKKRIDDWEAKNSGGKEASQANLVFF